MSKRQWKNYDNPDPRGDWWTRSAAPDDETPPDNDTEQGTAFLTAGTFPGRRVKFPTACPAYHENSHFLDRAGATATAGPWHVRC